MFKKVMAVVPFEKLMLLVWFEGGEVKSYDVAPLLGKWEPFKALADASLFAAVRVGPGGYAVVWNDDTDLASDELYENGTDFDVAGMLHGRVIDEASAARKSSGFSQARIGEASGVSQPVIARFETGETSPRLETLIKTLAPLGKTLTVCDIGGYSPKAE